jgi:hypothetical protein
MAKPKQRMPPGLPPPFRKLYHPVKVSPARSRSKAFHRARYALTLDGFPKMRSGSQPCAKGRITSQFETVMTDEAQGISRLSKEDLEMIERIASRYSDDIAVSAARSFERLEERIDAAESRLYSRLNDLEDAFAEKD